MYERTEIPKSCLLCDVCNATLSNGEFVAIDDSFWYQGWLYCIDCYKQYKPTMKLIMEIKKGDDLSATDLARPMVFESW
jgi:hypothetical protein